MFVHIRHQYVPRYHILRHLTAQGIEDARNEYRTERLSVVLVGSYIIPGTKFIAVKGFRNPVVAQLHFRQCSLFTRARNRDSGSSSTLRTS
uniref:T-box domain-containing protein n=1 Tax=Mesocestoides corti TaxID=53468 RepID=A0A5K3G2B8_MESCO